MQYRDLGNTGMKVSEIALGCEGFNNQTEAFAERMFKVAFDGGINCMDLYSPNPEIQKFVAKAMKTQRHDFVLQAHLCTVWQNGQYLCTRNPSTVTYAFDTMMKNLETDYLDVGMIHYVDSLATWQEIAEGPILEYALKLKQEGFIRSIGISSHNPKAALAAIDSGVIDVLMFSVNPCYDLQPGDDDVEKLWAEESYCGQLINMDRDRELLYEKCQRKNIGITVMKAFGGGDLLSDYSPAGKALSVVQCLHYALTRPAVACVMAGARSPEELLKSLAYETASNEVRDFSAAFASFAKISWEGHCMYCGHCAPCTKAIDVAMVNKLYSLAKNQKEIPETVREHYFALRHHAGECVACGQCEERCPFKVKVVEEMKKAAALFGK